MRDSVKVGSFRKILEALNHLLPGHRLKTWFFLNVLAKPRGICRKVIMAFYRQEHVYAVLREFARHYEGKFSVLEFGVADGYSFTKKLYATQYLGLEDRVVVHGFDTFEGLPDSNHTTDESPVDGESYRAGHFHGRYEDLKGYCEEKYSNFRLHKGLFEDTLTDEFLGTLAEYKPCLVWIDCDYYSSTMTVFKKLLPHVPTGCVFYFDDIYFNFSSRLTGEMRALWEVNQGRLGEGMEFVLDPDLSLDSNRVYRFIHLEGGQHSLVDKRTEDPVRRRRDDSPLP